MALFSGYLLASLHDLCMSEKFTDERIAKRGS